MSLGSVQLRTWHHLDKVAGGSVWLHLIFFILLEVLFVCFAGEVLIGTGQTHPVHGPL